MTRKPNTEELGFFTVIWTATSLLRSQNLMACAIRAHYRPRSEASEGYVFTGVCHSVTDQVGGLPGGGGGHHPHRQDTHHPPRKERSLTYHHHPPTSGHYAQAGGTHPTGMHICYIYFSLGPSPACTVKKSL